MRKYLPAAIILFSSFQTFSQTEFGLGYSMGIPMKEMAHHIQPAHQALVSGSLRLPIKKQQLWIGVEASLGGYAHKKIEQTFTFSDGTSTKTDVRYNSNVAIAQAVLRYDLPIKGPVVPYVRVGGGATSFYTNIYIEDPNDPDGCKALDKDLPLKDFSMVYSYGGGVKINLNKNKNANNDCMLDVSVNSVNGGNIDYLNVKHLSDHQHQDNSASTNGSKPYTAKFINVNTQAIHEHQLAEVHTSQVKLLQLKVGFILKFENSKSVSSKNSKRCHNRSSCKKS